MISFYLHTYLLKIPTYLFTYIHTYIHATYIQVETVASLGYIKEIVAYIMRSDDEVIHKTCVSILNQLASNVSCIEVMGSVNIIPALKRTMSSHNDVIGMSIFVCMFVFVFCLTSF